MTLKPKNSEFNTDEPNGAPDPAGAVDNPETNCLIASAHRGPALPPNAIIRAANTPEQIAAARRGAELIKPVLEKLGIDPNLADGGFRSENAFVTMLNCAAYGYRGFPVTCPDKDPTIKKWQINASSDAATLLKWESHFHTPIGKPDRLELGSWVWLKFKSPNYALLTGREGGVWILDIDGQRGRERLAELEAKLGPLPDTVTVVSGRPDGGEHRWFAPSPNGRDLKTVGHALIDGKRDKIDQKGRGGYAVLPGSLHESGTRYRFADGRAPDEHETAFLPPEWLAVLDYADEPAKAREPSARKSSGQRFRAEHDPSSLLIGDGEGYGGFQNPIYKNAIQYFFGAGVDGPAEPIITVLREMIVDAPKDNERDVSRYVDGPDLPRIVERARAFVNSVKDSVSDEY